MIDCLYDLLIEFDEMGFAPTTVCPDPEAYANEWREKVLVLFNRMEAENAALRERLEKAVELPCKVGDTVYLISQTARCPHGEVVEAKITDFIGFSDGYRWTAKGKKEWFSFNKSDIDAWAFTTREAAEDRLAELKGEKR